MNSGGSKPNQAQQKALIYSLIAIFVTIVGVIISIVIISNLKSTQPSTPEPQNYGTYTDQSIDIYEETINKILDQADKKGSDNINDTLALYQVYIEKTTDGGAKALLYTDYYMTLMSLDTTLSMKDQVIEGLITADNTIEDAGSAFTVSNAATYYQDSELAAKYQEIANSRMGEAE